MNTEKFFQLWALLGMIMLAAACTPTGDRVASDRECRAVDSGGGSRMRQSVCLSKEQWAAIDAEEANRRQNETDTDEYLRGQLERSAAGVSAPTF